jgi:hypothetical protein
MIYLINSFNIKNKLKIHHTGIKIKTEFFHKEKKINTAVENN